MDNYRIRKMNKSELQLAVDWAAAEGWNPGLHDAEHFFNGDEQGFFAGEINGRIVAVGSAVCYDDSYAFCGLYIVDPEFRGRGLGFALTKARLEYCGKRNTGIDGVLENVDIYQRVGYKPFYMNHRFQTEASAQGFDHKSIKPIEEGHIAEIINYDRQCFPAKRETFLRQWIQQAEGRSLLFSCEGKIQGFAVRRKCLQGYKVGPLFADNIEVARELFKALQDDIHGEIVILDVPENNPAAMLLARDNSMQKVFATMRMYQKGLPDIDHDKIYGITTFELG
ncbi:GNAT family N-acetyltransferase [Psychromonas ossibalaenae]|uniref:GNAT family N-acetyltransferase n=1 Tax=Psychromonas ossibalaenae TaxID=444922 RepID=UPI00035F9C92|nr:GNAT family N-acetyltransferase [Psychromonas ossibalaenae]